MKFGKITAPLQERENRFSDDTSSSKRSALIEVGETIAASVTLFARVSGYAPCFARAIALVAYTSVGKEQLQQVLLPKVKAV
jgi:hypothetical protein